MACLHGSTPCFRLASAGGPGPRPGEAGRRGSQSRSPASRVLFPPPLFAVARSAVAAMAQ